MALCVMPFFYVLVPNTGAMTGRNQKGVSYCIFCAVAQFHFIIVLYRIQVGISGRRNKLRAALTPLILSETIVFAGRLLARSSDCFVVY